MLCQTRLLSPLPPWRAEARTDWSGAGAGGRGGEGGDVEADGLVGRGLVFFFCVVVGRQGGGVPRFFEQRQGERQTFKNFQNRGVCASGGVALAIWQDGGRKRK